MDYQTLFNVGSGVVLTTLGWFARELWGAVKELRRDLSDLREQIAREYVSKDDFHEVIRRVEDLLVRIDAKLDRKQDK